MIKKDETRINVYCCEPNPDLFYFDGLAEIKTGRGADSDSEVVHKQLTLDNFLPRGSILRNTGGDGILALTLYTGNDSKLILNQGKTKYKRSNADITLNKIFII